MQYRSPVNSSLQQPQQMSVPSYRTYLLKISTLVERQFTPVI